MLKIRSLLSVPGCIERFIDAAPSRGADALTIDLEDSVPASEKEAARALVAARIPYLIECGQRVYVRVNRNDYLYSSADLHAVVQPGLEGITAGKVASREDLYVLDMMLSDLEASKGMPIGSVAIQAILETPSAIEAAYQIALCPRVTALCCAPAMNGDLVRTLGIEWTTSGVEQIYVKSRVVVAAKAAGKMALGGMWEQIRDLEGFRKFAKANRQLGFDGEVVLHPSAIALANEIFGLSAHDIEYCRALIKAFEEAETAGRGAMIFDGRHIDLAHVKMAREIVASSE